MELDTTIETLKMTSWAGNTLYEYVWSLGIFIILYILFKIFQSIVLAKLRKVAKHTKTEFDDIIIEVFKNIRPPLYTFVALYFALTSLLISNTVWKIITILFVILIIFELIRAIERFFDLVFERYLQKTKRNEQRITPSMMNALRIIIRLVLWSIGLLLILSNIGINVTSLIASFGIGGIAIALAAQNILGDLFSSFSIYIDQPFRVGDYIEVDEHSGVVRKIGLKTTRLQTLRGEELVISNQELTKTRVQNFKQLEKRRIKFNLGIEYGTSAEKLEKIPKLVERIIQDIEMTEFERCFFKEYGDFSLIYECTFYVESDAYGDAVQVIQKINLGIYKSFEKEGLNMAFPTQTIHLNK